MTAQQHRRGHERSDHLALKQEGRQLLLRAGCEMVCCELHGADVIGYRKAGARILTIAIEYERSVRNVLRNIRRDHEHQVDLVVTAGMTPEVTQAALRLVDRQLTPAERTRVRVLPVSSVTEVTLRGLMDVDSGLIQGSPDA